jgi:hypothetical protein
LVLLPFSAEAPNHNKPNRCPFYAGLRVASGFVFVMVFDLTHKCRPKIKNTRQTLVASNSHKRFSYLKPLFVPPLLNPLSPARTANCKEKLQLLSQRWLKAVFPSHAVKKIAG